MIQLIHVAIITKPKLKATNVLLPNYFFSCGASEQAKSMSKQTIKLIELVVALDGHL